MSDDKVVAEGWYLTNARPMPGYAGSANGPEHYFRDGKSLCGKRDADAISLLFLGPKPEPLFAKSCRLCNSKRTKES